MAIMNRFARICAVTVGLAFVGLVVGGLAGALPLLALAAVFGLLTDPHAISHALNIGGGTGAVLGLILGPSIAWGSLRHVPLGKAISRTFIGTLLGGIAGLLFINLFPFMPVVGAVAGFLQAASRLADTPQPAGPTV